ncbi:MAG: DNA topoisomerase IV subunit A [Candidatus Bathyarchaeia archaeon]
MAKKSKTSKKLNRAEQKRRAVLTSLKTLGEQVYTQLSNRQWPSIQMPSRSITNIHYDQETRQYILGEHSVKRSARNIRHVRPLTQLVWTGSFVDELTREGKTSTLRDVFYSAQAYEMSFTDQAESDDIITDLETVLGHQRENFNVFPEERSAIFGDLTIQYTVPGYEGKTLNLASHPDGMMIGPALTNAEFGDCGAEMIIAIEKGGLFTRFIEEKVHEKFKALLIHTAGQAPRATRSLLRRMSKELKLPVYIFCDADPWGMHIANVIIAGSANAAHLRELNTPDAKWAGVWASDIVNYKLPSNPLTDLDIKRLYELQKDPRYDGKLWKKEIETFLKVKKKAEQEAFSRYGLAYIVDKYLPAKLKEIG